ncbi:hypothetical protein DPV78_006875 [Talaromyces pinophilus]|nr:hypothetical protein DPV78_006875 [Talaromyces pinophilus]
MLDNINITTAGSYTWTIDIASTSLANTEYVLRFLPPHVEYDTTSVQISSPGFIVIQKSATTTSEATSTVSTSVSITNTASTTLTSTTTTIPSPTSNASSTGPRVGAKAGIGVGASTIGAAAIILSILGAFMFRRRRLQKSIITDFVNPPDYYMVTGNRIKHHYSQGTVHELPIPPVELDEGGRF